MPAMSHPVIARPAPRRPRRTGQALVEFALVIPIFLLMLFGLIDMGRFVFMSSTLSQAAREGARLAAVEAYWMGSADPSCNTSGGPVCPANLAALRANVLSATNRMLTPFANITNAQLFTSCDAGTPPSGSWTTTTCNSNQPQNLASVRVVVVFTPITPVIGQMFSSITNEASATMVIN
jgi:hypothetical protein